ncbi:MAG TPA: dephospho-CoA kinase [Ruminococcaceae bacterium]|nr:dephospho-CoA kinase [Oscillospiraceae bacterium]HCA30529.1 dephospho-CoA kinase [Oscillospiraceae bacterium]
MIEKLFVVGLTGPTGSGKSEVSRVLENRDIHVIDADLLARKVVEPGTECLKKLVEAFSDKILNLDGTLNRKELARLAFSSLESSKLLNSITHPYIIAMTKTILMNMEQAREAMAVIDAPLLFESGMDTICDLTVAVVAPYEVRLQRILKRDKNLDEKQARARMSVQQPEQYYTQRAAIVLNSSGDLDQLRAQAEELARNIREWAYEK